MMKKLEEILKKEEAIIAAYEAAKAAGDEAGVEKAKADMRVLRGTYLTGDDEEFCFVHRLMEEKRERENDFVDIHDPVWKPEETIATLRKYGIKTFTFSSGWSSAVDTAWAFQEAGCRLVGLIEINGTTKAFLSDEWEKKHGYVFTIEEV